MKNRIIVLAMCACALLPGAAAAQIVLGGGAGIGSIPRAMAPLCNGARRLGGAAFSATGGVDLTAVQVRGHLDYVHALSVSVAECLAGRGVRTDSAFADADRSAATLGAGVWRPLSNRIDLGAEAGVVLEHDAWYVGGGLGAQRGFLRAELVGRLHTISFQEITRDFESRPVREISRRDGTERSWGAVLRILLVTRKK